MLRPVSGKSKVGVVPRSRCGPTPNASVQNSANQPNQRETGFHSCKLNPQRGRVPAPPEGDHDQSNKKLRHVVNAQPRECAVGIDAGE